MHTHAAHAADAADAEDGEQWPAEDNASTAPSTAELRAAGKRHLTGVACGAVLVAAVCFVYRLEASTAEEQAALALGSRQLRALANGTGEVDACLGRPKSTNVLIPVINMENTCDDDCRQVYCDSGLNGLAWADYNSYGFLLGMLGVFYMFLALAISCDEFFVPALDVIVEVLDLSPDIAGATFMAAGGSAPELFTAMVGTFQESNVGFGTIVGSAVFNVLFVIGTCAVASEDVLSLTWWPLARDCAYYASSLIVLALLFSYVKDMPSGLCGPECGCTPTRHLNDTLSSDADRCINCKAIYWWEALLLMLMYVGYVVVMKYNVQLHKMVQNMTGSGEGGRIHAAYGKGDMEAAQKVEEAPLASDDASARVPESTEQHDSIHAKEGAKSFNNPTNFRGGMLQILFSGSIVDSAAVHVIARIKGDVHNTFKQLDKSQDGYIDKKELGVMLFKLSGKEPSSGEVDQALAGIAAAATNWDDTRPNEVSLGEFCEWYLLSEARIRSELRTKLVMQDLDNNGYFSQDELRKLMKQMGHPATEEELDGMRLALDTNNDGKISIEEFESWYKESEFFTKKKEANESQVEQKTGSALDWPRGQGAMGLLAKAMFLFLLPLNLVLFCTLPDVRKDSKRKYFVFTFIGAIMWIAVFSYFMVLWATGVGCRFGIKDEVMGLTALAAGTSVPDLLTSIIVAKQGHGDMAVSSSIGSNIFDVLVGLPLPWLAFSIYRFASFDANEMTDGALKWPRGTTAADTAMSKVAAPNLLQDLAVLLLMIGLVVGMIICNKWRMTKGMGYTFFAFYFIFVFQSLAATFKWFG